MIKLVIVESPAKAKTINKYLGKDYKVLASYGHVRDLLPKQGAVDTGNDFAMKYHLIEKNLKHLDAIAKAMKSADTLMLATDPDREGEAISWHILEYLKEKKILKDKPAHRVVFHEITKKAIQEAIEHPREIAMDLVNAQQARRALDYLVGFNLSPLLWKKIRRGLSAGRVQSPALRLIVERELEIEKFESREYWTIEADLEKTKNTFSAKLTEYQTKKIKQFDINNETQAETIRQDLAEKAGGHLLVTSVTKKQRGRNPTAPFITSTLQQEAARKLGFTAQRTMRTAQSLYEGVDIGIDSTGLITYMRTDSVNLANEAVEDIRALIARRYGEDNLPKEARVFKTKSKNAQEAHEAIRPTAASRTPDSIKEYLSKDQYKLYNLIWQRTIASQMISATIDTVAIDFLAGPEKTGGKFRANGSTIKIPGFMAVYQEGIDDAKKTDDDEKLLPELKEGDKVMLAKIRGEQHFTDPPPRFTEASLVKTLEEYGIGRPSTYASIISTLQARGYALLEKKRFEPTDVGRIVIKFLTEYFTTYVDFDFTAGLEDKLDEVARGEMKWIPVLKDFWGPFDTLVHKIDETVQRSDVTQEALDEKCPECSKPLSIRLGRNGRFIGCTAYPECGYTRSMTENKEEEPEIDLAGRKCDDCKEGDLVIKHGPYGKFIGCSNYPKCKHIESIVKPKDTGVQCPECKKANMVQRSSRRGKVFFSCENYPACKYATWNEPIAEKCPECEWPILTLKTTKRRGSEKVCPQEKCKFTEPVEEDDQDEA